MDDLQTMLRDRIRDELNPLLSGRAERFHLIDPPDHPNVGDCAILLGELDFIAREFPTSDLRFHDYGTYAPSADKHIEKASVLLIHGGGNFGDIWPHHHKIRLMALERFRNRPIVQLPQSIHFSSAQALRETQDAIASHPDFTLLVRDTRSEKFARQNFECRVVLCPDMAFAMEPMIRLAPRVEAFCLLRGDKEAVAPHGEIEQSLCDLGLSTEVGDWLDDPRTPSRVVDRGFSRLTRELHAAYPLIAPFALHARRRYAEQRLAVGIEMLSRGKVVVTDRLHAHIMSALLGIPNVVFRSFDAKAAALFDTWTHTSPICRLADHPSDLAGQVRDIMPLR